jgi:4-hydroxybenzoate polyprenyltransferase
LHLLNSSTVVAISGGFRLHIAFLLAGLTIRIPVYCAGALIIYATYTLDRTLDSKEDAINKSELCGADKRIGLVACIASFFLGAYILALSGIYLAPVFPFIIGYFYTHGIRIGSSRLKLKGSLGVKNIIIGITWGGTIALIVSKWCDNILTIGVIFLFYGLKTFVTSCVNDFKDVKGDMAAGIRTLPACLGEAVTKKVLIIIFLGLNCVMFYSMLLDIIRNEWIVLLFSLVITISFLLIYSPAFENNPSFIYRKIREIAISWESAIALALRAYIVH